MVVTSLDKKVNKEKYAESKSQLTKVLNLYKIKNVFELNYLPSKISYKDLNKLIKDFSEIFMNFKPNELFIPHCSDVHTDHQIIFKALSSTTKTFRYPFIKKILSYETISETGFGLKEKDKHTFNPDYFIDISKFFEKKNKNSKTL